MKVTNTNGLEDFFISHGCSKRLFVSSKLRKNWIIENRYVVRDGKHYEIRFIDKKGGVWEAYLLKAY